MAQIYVSDETQELLKEVSQADQRTQDGEILHLLKGRKRELDMLEEHKKKPF